jgi:hypothetical protein
VFDEEIASKIIKFIASIGIPINEGNISAETVLPGIQIENGTLIFDKEKLLYPGDLLHEAGHIAVKSNSERSSLNINVGNDPAEEMMTLAWSFAAIVDIGLPPEVVFHPYGYKGASENLIHYYTNGSYIGLPMLQWLGMTVDSKKAAELNIEPFPKMIKWLRD